MKKPSNLQIVQKESIGLRAGDRSPPLSLFNQSHQMDPDKSPVNLNN